MALNRFPDSQTVTIPEIPTQATVSLPADKSAVIVVDMQNDFVRPDGALYVEAAAGTVDVIADVVERARIKNVPVVYTRDTHGEEDREFEIWPRHCVRGTRGWQIVEELSPQEGDLIVDKNRYDGFYSTPMEHYLSRVWDVEHVVIMGTVANICVGQTAASAGLRWFHVVTPADGISAMNDFDQASALRQISFLYNGTIAVNGADIEFTPGRD